MIGNLLSVVGPEGRQPLRRNISGLVTEAILMGLGFALLVPTLRTLFANDIPATGVWLAVMTGVLIVYSVVRYRTQLSGYRAAINLASALFARLGEHVARLPLGWFGGDRVGHLGRLTSQGVIDIMGVPAHLLRPVVTALVTPATVIALMFVFDWRLAVAALLTAPVAAVVYRWSGSLVQKTDHRVHAAGAEAANRIVEFAQAQAVLRAFGQANSGLSKLDAALADQREAGRKQIFTAARGLVSFVFVVQAAFTVILLFGINLALGGEIDVAELVALLVLAVRYVEPLIVAADVEGALRISRNSLTRMSDLLATPPLPEPETGKTPTDSSIRFEQVRFAYDETPLLEGISFTADASTMTAIVGPSGTGKTTLLRLISRFWDVTGGSVQVGGVDVRHVSTEDLMGMISVVFQDVYLFDGSIADNIRLGRPDATDAQVLEVARLAQVDEIIDRLPGGIDAPVGEGGAVLSGGERQRVSIARAILKDAPIVLLDEATSALDPINEAAVQQALHALTRKKTLVIVAHRLQTIRSADRIIFIDEGTVLEQGPHEELVAADGRYAAFWNERHRAAGWRLAG